MEPIKRSLALKQIGGFYHAYEEDSYILYYLFGYKIKDDRCGFPHSALTKVINTLDNNRINYSILEKGKNIEQDFRRNNHYNKYLELGKSKYQLEQKKSTITERILSLNDTDFDQLINVIEGYLNNATAK